MRVAIFALACFVCFVALSFAEAHKSVRHIKPQTEELRELHHMAMWTQPPKEDGDHVFMKKILRSEYDPLDHGHKNRHKRWGPEHPDHTRHKNWHFKAPKFHNGQKLSEDIMDEDLHLFGVSRRHELWN